MLGPALPRSFACPVCRQRTVSPFRKLAIASRARSRCSACGCRLALAHPRTRSVAEAVLGTSVVYACLVATSYWPLLAALAIWLVGAQFAALTLDRRDKLSLRLANGHAGQPKRAGVG